MSYETSFPYVNAYWHPAHKGSKGRGYGRYLVRDLDKKIRAPSKNQNCFCSIQRYRDAIIPNPKNEPEVHYCGFFFDFDARPKDFGGSAKKAIETAMFEVKQIANIFKGHEVEEPHMQVWFSGSKGFHLIVHPAALGITPSRHNTYIMKVGANFLAQKLDLKTLDLSVYTEHRMWRMVNSIHQSAGRFKIELYHSELDKTYEEIVEMAKTHRDPLYDTIEYEDIKPSDDAVALWKRLQKEYEDQQDLEKLKPAKKIVVTKEWPACVKDVMTNGLKRDGTRNKATMALASYFCDIGMEQGDCLETLLDWVQNLPDPDNKRHERVANTKAVVRSIYGQKTVKPKEPLFACQYIRAVSSADNKVACTERDPEGCDAIENNPDNQRPARIPQLPLSKASEATFIGKKVIVPVMITGKADSPYAYPRKVDIKCKPNMETQMCQSCRIAGHGGSVEVDFQMQDQTLIDLINCTSGRRNAIIKRHAGVPVKCYANHIEVVQYGNLEEVRLQPNVMMTGVVDSRPGVNGDGNMDPIDEGSYCQRLAYFIGHDIAINKKYDITAYVWGHPKDQKVCHIFDVAKPAQDDIDKFRMSKDMYNMLRMFQPAPGQSVEEKFKDIHDDLESNVHMIWGRREVAISLDLVYHSPVGFYFQSQYEKKGWLELLVLGDSGNGKTKLIERVMNHYRLGEITGVEGGKRTGLIWANHNIGGRFMLTWGKIPQNDRRLIVLDEFSGMPDEEVATMTRLRTEGIAESQGINPAMTNSRTRMVFLSNAKNGRPLNSHNYGVEAVNKLFKEHQDVRRLDIAVCVQSGDIPLEVINKKHKPDLSTHAYTTDPCKNLVLWAWSRDPRQVKFVDDTEDLILQHAITVGRKYRCDIVLVEPSDQRIKIARLAAAVAARMFSTDEEGKLLLVRPEHVEFAVKFLQQCYDHKAMQYNIYAKLVQGKMFLSEDQKVELKRKFLNYENFEHLRTIFLSGTYFRKGELVDLTGWSKEDVSSLLKELSLKHLIRATTGGYRKTPMFTQFLKEFDTIDNTDPPF